MRKIFLALFFVSIIISCVDKHDDITDKRTKIFSSYLKNNFSLNFPVGLHYYILVSDFGCHGCKVKTVNDLYSYIDLNRKKYFTIISADQNLIPDSLKIKTEYINDSEKKLESLNLDLANVTLIEVKDKKITLIKSFNPNDPPITDFIKLR
ncbi:MAG: hypothetical protein ROY99_00830 [Ignavibacterium sp.]|jgi:hypothetical protein|nr:hypothetical protein [Ignavibacterium sp.]